MRTMLLCAALLAAEARGADAFPKPYSPPCVERENVFEFVEKPAVKKVGEDRYEIAFAVKGNCDVTVGIVDPDGKVVRHLGAGVLGANAPAPFQKNSLKQTLVWNGKCDLGAYPAHPETLRVRVMLGLKPVFDKRLGGTSPHALPGSVWSIAVDPHGAYVFTKGWQIRLRKFDRDGNYVGALFPPPADMPESKLAGTAFVEYEPGKRAWHGRNLYESCGNNGMVFPIEVDYKGPPDCQVAVAGNRLFFTSAGKTLNTASSGSFLYYLHTDGSTDEAGMAGRPFAWGAHPNPQLAVSPDGKWLYMVDGGRGKYTFDPCVVRAPADGGGRAEAFAGRLGQPGSDNVHLGKPVSLDCDAKGRVYVADAVNNRVQVFSPDGAWLKTLPVDRPGLVRVHQKTGAIFVQHMARAEGRSFARLTKFSSFDRPAEEFHADGISSTHMAVDSWCPRTRLWLGGGVKATEGYDGKPVAWYTVRILEEDGSTLRMLRDFDEEGRKAAGGDYTGWAGDNYDKVVCDPLREHVYYRNSLVFDLRTGRRLGRFSPATSCRFDDMAFDKRGYAHLHFNPTFFQQGVGRVDPSAVSGGDRAQGRFVCPERPYDYGVEARGWLGIIPTRDQGGAKGFQDGLGVNMQGDVASESNIYYVPKMEEVGIALARAGINAHLAAGMYYDNNEASRFERHIAELQKRGEEIYFIQRRPGHPLAGGTVWTYDRTGELRQECAVVAGALVNGVQMDEDGKLHFVTNRPRLLNGRPFLAGKAGLHGGGRGDDTPWTGTLMKTAGGPARLLFANAAVPLDPAPDRPPDTGSTWGDPGPGYAEGMEWLYAGASPIVRSGGCSCPRQHLGLDWFKRVYVPEGYRHSIGILDGNGNLILHVGRYGNFDDAPGGKNGARPGGTDIGMMLVRFVSATDNYLAYGDWGEKLVVLKLEYHAEGSAGIPGP